MENAKEYTTSMCHDCAHSIYPLLRGTANNILINCAKLSVQLPKVDCELFEPED